MRGFSLIEILIAAALLALMGVILIGTLTSSLNTRDKVEQLANRHHYIRQALARMAADMSQAYISNNQNPQRAVMQSAFWGKKNSVSFVAFGGLSHRQDAKESGEREISYFIKDRKLMRLEKPNPGRKLWSDGKAKPICPGVDKLELKYWNVNSQSWDSRWNTEERPMPDASLPIRVRIELTSQLSEERD